MIPIKEAIGRALKGHKVTVNGGCVKVKVSGTIIDYSVKNDELLLIVMTDDGKDSRLIKIGENHPGLIADIL